MYFVDGTHYHRVRNANPTSLTMNKPERLYDIGCTQALQASLIILKLCWFCTYRFISQILLHSKYPPDQATDRANVEPVIC
jgi:hypothetical protein